MAQVQQRLGIESQIKFNGLERVVLKRSHPRGILINSVGWIWGAYYLSNQMWVEALFAVVVMGLVAQWSVRRVDPGRMAETMIGRMGLLHTQPINLTGVLLGLAYTIYGISLRDARIVICGLSTVLLGHVFGWARVDSRFDVGPGESRVSPIDRLQDEERRGQVAS